MYILLKDLWHLQIQDTNATSFQATMFEKQRNLILQKRLWNLTIIEKHRLRWPTNQQILSLPDASMC